MNETQVTEIEELRSQLLARLTHFASSLESLLNRSDHSPSLADAFEGFPYLRTFAEKTLAEAIQIEGSIVKASRKRLETLDSEVKKKAVHLCESALQDQALREALAGKDEERDMSGTEWSLALASCNIWEDLRGKLNNHFDPSLDPGDDDEDFNRTLPSMVHPLFTERGAGDLKDDVREALREMTQADFELFTESKKTIATSLAQLGRLSDWEHLEKLEELARSMRGKDYAVSSAPEQRRALLSLHHILDTALCSDTELLMKKVGLGSERLEMGVSKLKDMQNIYFNLIGDFSRNESSVPEYDRHLKFLVERLDLVLTSVVAVEDVQGRLQDTWNRYEHQAINERSLPYLASSQ